MSYITIRRFHAAAICGNVNLPYGTACECVNGIITYEGNQLCYNRSQNAYDYFASNDDGMGLKRGKLIQNITRALANPSKRQERWDRIWGDTSLHRFRRNEEYADPNTWLWNFDFFNASIEDLAYIWKIVR